MKQRKYNYFVIQLQNAAFNVSILINKNNEIYELRRNDYSLNGFQ